MFEIPWFRYAPVHVVRRRRPVDRLKLFVEQLERREVLDTGLGSNPASSLLISGLYNDLLHRVPQPSEIAGWQSALNAGLSLGDVARAFLASPEYQSDFITQTYATVLKRGAQPQEVNGWLQAMQAGLSEEGLTALFLASAEYYNEHGGTAESWLGGLYSDVFQRTPDAAGLLHWSEELQNGTSRESVALGFVTSQEANTWFVTVSYQQFLGRAPDLAGETTWVSALDAGLPRSELIAGIIGSPEYASIHLAGPASSMQSAAAVIPNTSAGTLGPLTPELPIVSLGPDVVTGEGEPVQFGGVVIGGVSPYTYTWDFGDGDRVMGSLSPTYTYANSGTFTATLTVTDALNQVGQGAFHVTVQDSPPTVAIHGAPASSAAGIPIVLTSTIASPSTADMAAGFRYSWNVTKDGSSFASAATPNFNFTPLQHGTYVVTLVATAQDNATGTANTTITVTDLAIPNSGAVPLSIPDFGAQPTIYSVASGDWSNPATWSAGRIPGAGDIVDINPGTTVTYDVNSTAALNTLEIQPTGTLTFRTDINTQVVVGNFLVLQEGTLQVGTAANPIAANVQATISLGNQPLNAATDPQQFGDGLIVLGNVTMHGPVKTPFVTLAQEAHAGDTVLHLASAVTGWQPGDDPLLPDTRQLFPTSDNGSNYQPHWERATIQSVSADGLSVNLTAPLRFDHLGARDANGVLDYLPQVMNDSRSIMVQSANMTGIRGYTLYTDRANVDIEYAGFCELGRTISAAPINGGNPADRYAMTMLDLIGPTTPQANGHQFTLLGDEVDNDGDGNPNNPSNIQWGIALNNSFYGLIQDNTVFAVAGAGIGVEDGASSYNVFDHNFVANVNGTSKRLDDQSQGDGYWFHNPNNYVTNNIATDINPTGTDAYSYGFSVDAVTNDSTAVGTVAVPVSQGADPSQPGQSTSIDMNATPLLEFSGNEVYGATSRGFSTWWLGALYETPKGNAGTMKNSVVWNQSDAAYFTYETNNLVIDGFVVRGDAAQLGNPNLLASGLHFGDYMTRNAVVQNVDVQDENVGVTVPNNVGRGGSFEVVNFTIQNSYLRNIRNILVPQLMSSNGGQNLSSRTVIIQDVKFAYPSVIPNGSQSWNIYMDPTQGADPSFFNFMSTTVVNVSDYNGVTGDNFQVYFNYLPFNISQMPDIFGYVL
jgi:hypothetical protein